MVTVPYTRYFPLYVKIILKGVYIIRYMYVQLSYQNNDHWTVTLRPGKYERLQPNITGANSCFLILSYISTRGSMERIKEADLRRQEEDDGEK